MPFGTLLSNLYIDEAATAQGRIQRENPMTISNSNQVREDCVTIIARTADEVMDEARARGLCAQGYLVAGRAVPHRFAVAGEDSELFGGEAMIAVTWTRREASGPAAQN